MGERGRSVFQMSLGLSLFSMADTEWLRCTEQLFTVSGAVGPSSSCALAILTAAHSEADLIPKGLFLFTSKIHFLRMILSPY